MRTLGFVALALTAGAIAATALGLVRFEFGDAVPPAPAPVPPANNHQRKLN